MAKFLLQQSLRLVKLSATSFVCRHMFATNVMGTVPPPGTSSLPGKNCYKKLEEEAAAMPTRVNKFAADDKEKLPSIINSSPWLMLPGENNHNLNKLEEGTMPMMVHKFYSLSENRVITMNNKSSGPDPDAHCVGSSYGWLGFINRRPDFDFFLVNPITGRSIKLPSIRMLNMFQRCEKDSYWDVYKKDAFWNIMKFVMSSPNPDAENCRVLIQYRTQLLRNNILLAFCCPGLGDGDNDSSSWTFLRTNYFDYYMHIEYSPKDEKFFAMLGDCHSFTSWENDEDFVGSDISMDSWDLSDPRNPKRYPVLPGKKGLVARAERVWESLHSAHYLIKNEEYQKRYDDVKYKSYLIGDPSLSSGQLFWIDRFTAHDGDRDDNCWHFGMRETLWTPEVGSDPVVPYATVSFDVYKLDTCYSSGRKLEYMESLGDGALFIGSNGGFRLSANDFPELKPNSIYFTDDLAKIYFCKTIGGHDIGIYNYQDKTIAECYYPVPADDIKKYKDIDPAPLWFTPSYTP